MQQFSPSLLSVLPNGKPRYRTVPVADFYEQFKQIERVAPTCFLLESLGSDNADARYAVIGFNPETVVRGRGTTIFVNDKPYSCKNPYQALQSLVPPPLYSRNYAGGLVGYFSYDAVNYMESAVQITPHPLFDQFMFGVYTDGLIFDKTTSETTYFYYDHDRFDALQSQIEQALPRAEASVTRVGCRGDTMDRKQHGQTVAAVQEEIRAGNVFQCEVGMKTEYNITGPIVPLYSKLREINPSPHMYYLKFGDRVIMGASPELLIRVRGSEMETFPLAGTIRRGDTDSEDQHLARTLLCDQKEQAEHAMLVDLHRNDLGKVARFGTVAVRRYREVKKFSHVQHLSSEISGIMRSNENMFSVLASVFPAGTLTGAPKIESMRIIERSESSPRGPYGGAVGHFGFNGDCTFAIPIRTLFFAGEYAYTQTCGGIVLDSDPANEYQELLQKRAAMDTVMQSFT